MLKHSGKSRSSHAYFDPQHNFNDIIKSYLEVQRGMGYYTVASTSGFIQVSAGPFSMCSFISNSMGF